MKLFFCVLSWFLAASLSAWDLNTAQTWEATLAPVMQNENISQLEHLIVTDPATTLTQRAILGIAEHNLERKVPHQGWATKAVNTLTPLTQENLGDELEAILLPYLGSSLGLQAQDDFFPLTKLLEVNHAFSVLDQAVQRYGQFSYYPQLIRASVDMDVPSFFNKAGQAKEDLETLLAWRNTHPEALPSGALAQVHLLWGLHEKNDGHREPALAAWKLALQEDPQQVGAGKKAAEYLTRYQN